MTKQIQVPLRIPRDFHARLHVRMAEKGCSFQGVVTSLLERWAAGEFDRRFERPLTEAEREEDEQFLRVAHAPSGFDEEVISFMMNYWLKMRQQKKE
jgi:hypothetical protein